MGNLEKNKYKAIVIGNETKAYRWVDLITDEVWSEIKKIVDDFEDKKTKDELEDVLEIKLAILEKENADDDEIFLLKDEENEKYFGFVEIYNKEKITKEILIKLMLNMVKEYEENFEDEEFEDEDETVSEEDLMKYSIEELFDVLETTSYDCRNSGSYDL